MRLYLCEIVSSHLYETYFWLVELQDRVWLVELKSEHRHSYSPFSYVTRVRFSGGGEVSLEGFTPTNK